MGILGDPDVVDCELVPPRLDHELIRIMEQFTQQMEGDLPPKLAQAIC